jgi:hypothetical protein
VQDGGKDLDQLMNSRSTHLAKQEECMKKIRDLGSLPADAFEAYCILFLHDFSAYMTVCPFNHYSVRSVNSFIKMHGFSAYKYLLLGA